MSEGNKEEYNLEPLAEMVFIGEIVFQIKIAQRAAERLFSQPNKIDQTEIWCSIQSILVATANVSKILWPHKNFADRSEKLRKLLNVDKENMLSKRQFRNHFEHYDERIERWFKEKDSAVYADNIIEGYREDWGEMTTNYHRSYNPMTQSVNFRGESINIGEVLEELEKIILKCQPYALI